MSTEIVVHLKPLLLFKANQCASTVFLSSRHAQGARHRDAAQQEVADPVGNSTGQDDSQDR